MYTPTISFPMSEVYFSSQTSHRFFYSILFSYFSVKAISQYSIAILLKKFYSILFCQKQQSAVPCTPLLGYPPRSPIRPHTMGGRRHSSLQFIQTLAATRGHCTTAQTTGQQSALDVSTSSQKQNTPHFIQIIICLHVMTGHYDVEHYDDDDDESS